MALRIEIQGLDLLIAELSRRGYTVIGPRLKDQAIVYDELRSASDLPIGWSDEQEAGRYRLRQRSDRALFGYVVGPHSWKRFLHPAECLLWKSRGEGDQLTVEEPPESQVRYAFLGVRACELAAISIQDNVFLNGAYVDEGYKRRRENVFFIAVNCTVVGGTCFCVSMNTGPKAKAGFDLSLTEVINDAEHYLLLESGSDLGKEIMDTISGRPAVEAESEAAERAITKVADSMGRTLDTEGIKELLYSQLDHPRWDEVATRCLSCANCTMVCPTCFCTSVEEHTDLLSDSVERVRKWDSCFNAEFSYVHGGSVRKSTQSRYRQWLTHKLATWIDQFGTSGCVGCGRCITWCPVGIDITEEVSALRILPGPKPG